MRHFSIREKHYAKNNCGTIVIILFYKTCRKPVCIVLKRHLHKSYLSDRWRLWSATRASSHVTATRARTVARASTREQTASGASAMDSGSAEPAETVCYPFMLDLILMILIHSVYILY